MRRRSSSRVAIFIGLWGFVACAGVQGGSDIDKERSGKLKAIAEVEDDVVWLEVAPEIELKISKAMIADKAPDDVPDDEADDAVDDEDDAELAERGDEG